jgi:hypothetical protein
MAYDGWIEFDGLELINLSRTAQLAATLGIDTLWVDPADVAWIETTLGGSLYGTVAESPWYDAAFPASAEFAGVVSLGFQGLDDSSAASNTTEYVTDGGNGGRLRSSTKPIVVSAAIIASTERGAKFGKDWLSARLRGSSGSCSGFSLRYFQWAASGAPKAHYRRVSLSRGISITRKRVSDCATTWLVTFTLTANDPFEYSEQTPSITYLGATDVATGPGITNSGGRLSNVVQTSCPAFDASPIYNPVSPALVPSPTAPNIIPDDWPVTVGATFQRWWAEISPLEPSAAPCVPVVALHGSGQAARVSIWDAATVNTDQCDPLWCAVISYLPPSMTFTIDGEQEMAYAWDGAAPLVRRADSLVFSPSAGPVEWTSFSNPSGYLVTLDVLATPVTTGAVNMSLALVSKTD